MKYTLFVLSLLILPTIVFAQEYGFVPLTQVPFLTDTGNSFDLSQFLNNLYRLAIGVAAVIAVLQIMRAGIMYMGGDSVTEKKEAKNLIGLSIAGLVLVLSPVVVFSIINPEILSLKINNIEQLAPTPGEVAGQGDGTCSTACDASQGQICRSGQCVAIDENTCPANISDGTAVPSERGQRCCAAQQGCSVQARREGNVDLMICSCAAPQSMETTGPASYRIAYQDTDRNNSDVAQRSRECVTYISETLQNQDACIFAEQAAGARMEEEERNFIYVKRCINNDLPQHRFSSLPTCS